ncbi:MAG: histidine phosphatase family protein [Tabrizicola sp.]|jgi:phosphohistidine phosphatase SixA|nr:histidine phosphatase family protein [Tabrizicola sp.]
MRLIALCLALAAPVHADPMAAAANPGVVLLMRNATAPGTGDPPDMRLDDCTTQRNLSDEGRSEARSIGERLRAAGISFDRILTSEWCRTRETAELLDLGPVTPFPPANSFFADRSTADSQTADVLAYLAALPGEERVLIVTHQVNITALTGVMPRSGEIVITRRSGDGLMVLDRLPLE